MSKNTYFEEFVDPFEKGSVIIRAEHLMRYIFAKDYLAKNRSQKRVIYDLGCGNGYGSEVLQSKGFHVIGFDRSEELLHFAHERQHSDLRFYHVDFEQTDLVSFVQKNNLPNPDAVICFEILEHIDSPEKLLSDIHRLLPQSGILILSVPNEKFEPKKKGKSRNKFHKHLFSKELLQKVLDQTHFVNSEWYGQPLPNTLLHLSRKFVKLLDFVCNHSPIIFQAVARILAYPVKNRISRSYSFLVTAEKKD